MRISAVVAHNLILPYPGEVRPAWQPGFVTTTHKFTLVRIITDEGIEVAWFVKTKSRFL